MDKRFNGGSQDGASSVVGDDCLAECEVYKETAKSNLVVVRRTRLYRDHFVTYHDFEKDPTDKKTWFLDRKCELEPAHAEQIGQAQVKSIRPGGTWTITAAVKSKRPELTVSVYSFNLVWPTTWAASGYTSFGFGFAKEEVAKEWHRLLQRCITALGEGTAPGHYRGRSSGMSAELSYTEDHSTQSSTHASLSRGGSGAVPAMVPKAKPQPVLDASAAVGLGAVVPGVPVEPIAEVDSDVERKVIQERSRRARRHRQQKTKFNKRWVPLRQTNGVAIYYHTNEDDSTGAGGEYMVSAIVRGSPKECLDVLISPESNTSILGPARLVEVLVPKSGTSDKEVLRIMLDCPALTSPLLTSREVVVERVVRTESEGAGLYAVLFSSCPTPAGVELESDTSKGGLLGWWRRPVLGTVRGGYTISPLEDSKLGTSSESLVTFICKVDMGGVCSERSWLHPFSYALGWNDALTDRILMSVNLVRDEVEQARFATQPFTMLGGAEDDEDEDAILAAGITGTLSGTTLKPTLSTTGGKGLMRLTTTRRISNMSTPTAVEPLPLPPLVAPGQPIPGLPNPLQQPPSSPISLPNGVPPPPPLGNAAAGAPAAVAEEDGEAGGLVDLEKMKSLSTLDPKFWDSLHTPGKAAPYSVRGPTYLKDKKKISAGEPQFLLSAVDLVAVDAPVGHIARFLPSIRESGAPFSIVIHLVIPGDPVLGLVLTFSHVTHPKFMGQPPAHPMEEEHDWSPFDFVLHRFVNGTEEVRNRMLKMIPHIADGSWMIRSSVGTTPVIIGKALKTKYHLTPTYLEVDIDITANGVANYVTGLVRGATTSLVIDFGFVLEGTTPWELPEFLLGAMRLWHLDVRTAQRLDTSREIPLKQPSA